MRYEKSFITIKLIWHSYLVFSLSNCVHKTPIESGLTLTKMPPTKETTRIRSDERSLVILLALMHHAWSHQLGTGGIWNCTPWGVAGTHSDGA